MQRAYYIHGSSCSAFIVYMANGATMDKKSQIYYAALATLYLQVTIGSAR
ncbi:hypothetical protein FOQG_05498 [Fusarium oxysporum f. sp. raphani 54005]|uniref:Uncharacterized protein n=2 Tax=Fusarium oxysporum TaxID=5507 RepID=X0CG28_FUSOX|nr:hypothetical protein FOQG_05498 [Fusarium oxysporum f. sp. raphani 54005]EXL73075.1 hypothetical protein FOPG_11532 [Fusarium oxysporum f. sp. conglutinans race 2 54008]